jgi:hypothetical protein
MTIMDRPVARNPAEAEISPPRPRIRDSRGKLHFWIVIGLRSDRRALFFVE